MKITGKTKIVGVIGLPISHTLSPLMHNSLFSFLDMDWVYLPFEVKPSALKSAIFGLSSLGIIGCNVTIPHKIEVMKYLTHINEKAKRIGAVNTILFKEEETIGFNTDGDGFIASLKNIGYDLKDKNVLLLGAGGAARAIAISLQDTGIKRLSIFDKQKERTKDLVSSIDNVDSISLDKVETLKDIDLLINATTCGMKEIDPLPCDVSLIHSDIFVYDIIYKKTRLLEEAEKNGAKTMNGREMLIFQGALSFEIWTGIYPPVDVMRKAIEKPEDRRQRAEDRICD